MKSLFRTIGLTFIILSASAAFSQSPTIHQSSIIKRQPPSFKLNDRIEKWPPFPALNKHPRIKLNIISEDYDACDPDTAKDRIPEEAKPHINKKLHKLNKNREDHENTTHFQIDVFEPASSDGKEREIDRPVCTVRFSEFFTGNGFEESSGCNLSSNENRCIHLLLKKPENKYCWVDLKPIDDIDEMIDPTSLMTLMAACTGGDEDKPPANNEPGSEPDDLLVFSDDEDIRCDYWIVFRQHLINLTIPESGNLSAAIANAQVQQHETVSANNGYEFNKYTFKRGLRGGSKNFGGAFTPNKSMTNNSFGGAFKSNPSFSGLNNSGASKSSSSSSHKGSNFGGGGSKQTWGTGWSGGGGQSNMGSAKNFSGSKIPGSK